MQNELKLLEELCQIFGPSGHEDEVREYLGKIYSQLGYKVLRDPFGNIYAEKKSKNPNAKKVLVIGHMDEVGFMVRKISPSGTIYVTPLGGFNSETILSSRAILKTEHKKFYGAVSSIPPHLLKNTEGKTPIQNMLFDFGFLSYEDAIKQGVQIGDPIILEGKFSVLDSQKRILSKAFDDRYGIALGIEMLKRLKDTELDYDLYIGGVCQEETGLRGSLCSANFIHPDFAIVLDCSTAMDSDGNTSELGQLGKGVLLRVVDSNMIARKDIIKFQKSTLEKSNVPYQYFMAAGGTDAGSIHKSISGIPTMTYCLVARNIHTCSSILDVDDYLNSIKGLESILVELNSQRISEFCYETTSNL